MCICKDRKIKKEQIFEIRKFQWPVIVDENMQMKD